MKNLRKARVRFGESVAEIGERGAQNDHALRDHIVELPWFGKKIIGPSGFRFVRLDAIDGEKPVPMVEVRAMLQLRDVPYLGSFECSDERLNHIWKTGAWTVHLNMQDYLWDGVKRDRLVWLGDMHPEVSVIGAVVGYNPVVNDSLDLVKGTTPPNKWINNISSYSMWWVIIHHDWYMMHSDLDWAEGTYPTPKGVIRVRHEDKRMERLTVRSMSLPVLRWFSNFTDIAFTKSQYMNISR